MFANRRREKRRAMEFAVAIALPDGTRLTECSIVDASETGAKLKLPDHVEVPDSFLLLLSSTGTARRNCTVMWRDKALIGVRFEKAGTDSPMRS